MNTVINTKELRAKLPQVVRQVSRGARFTVFYRSRPAFQLIPVNAAEAAPGRLAEETLYRAKPLGHSVDGKAAADHDSLLYGR